MEHIRASANHATDQLQWVGRLPKWPHIERNLLGCGKMPGDTGCQNGNSSLNAKHAAQTLGQNGLLGSRVGKVPSVNVKMASETEKLLNRITSICP